MRPQAAHNSQEAKETRGNKGHRFITDLVEEAIAGGPAGLRQAQRIALRYAKRFKEEATDPWKLETEWLKSFDAIHRARARYAQIWRPRFLAALSMCHSPELAARHARISCQMAYYHRKHDSEFAKQWNEAREYGIELLHARVFQRCVEGDLEPIMSMGLRVGWIRKFDTKLQIEMLRAHRPDGFKTPGTNVNLGTKGDIFVLTEEQRRELQKINQDWIRAESDQSVADTALLNSHAGSSNPEPFRCERCFKLRLTTELGKDGKTCLRCEKDGRTRKGPA